MCEVDRMCRVFLLLRIIVFCCYLHGVSRRITLTYLSRNYLPSGRTVMAVALVRRVLKDPG